MPKMTAATTPSAPIRRAVPDGQAEHADRSQTGHQHLAAFADQEPADPTNSRVSSGWLINGDGASAGEGASAIRPRRFMVGCTGENSWSWPRSVPGHADEARKRVPRPNHTMM